MSRTYRKPAELHYWRNADEYAKYRAGWDTSLRWRINREWVPVTMKWKKQKYKEEYLSWSRDGALRRGSRCKEFSDLCARDLRNANKEYIARARWDDEMPPDRKNGKKFIWAVW